MDSQVPPLRILLANDDPMSRLMTVLLLEACNYYVVAVVDGRAAVAVSAQTTFDLVLMDLVMTEMGGAEAVALIRERERRGDVRLPVVALTSYAADDDRDRLLAAGFDECLTRPTSEEILQETIARHVAPRTRGG